MFARRKVRRTTAARTKASGTKRPRTTKRRTQTLTDHQLQTRRRRIRRASVALISTFILGFGLLADWYGLWLPTEALVGVPTAMDRNVEQGPDATAPADDAPVSRNKDRGPFPISTSPAAPSTATPPSASSTPRARPPKAVTIVTKGSGDFGVAAGGTGRTGSGPLIKYQVDVERDLPYPPAEIATTVDKILGDPRSWAAAGWATFQRVDSGPVDLHILLATPATVDRLCAPLQTNGELSCRTGDRVVINAKRWAFGAEAFGKDVVNYRNYVVNHEVGHRLSKGHVDCAGAGQPAPVMMQQTKGVGSCKANPWPLGSELARD
ncbi:DUF3152 domain-containing protein [Actinopolymorpha sp. B11F2]|uniref:DUF3152 domain-containing protein n=1 Tax=Actinopolymorpha sp. B11F2 TaxID=3160862 RepID=UPI0032E477EE